VIIQAIILTTLLTNDPMIVIVPPVEAVEGALFNEYDWEYAIEARRRGGKGNKGRRRGGNGLR
tara:strand:+ start:52 stop:240 length:189 start_codon:yes stop_codon:yes gene_type:complete